MSHEDIVEKFQKVTRGLLSEPAQAALIAQCARLDELPERALTEFLA